MLSIAGLMDFFFHQSYYFYYHTFQDNHLIQSCGLETFGNLSTGTGHDNVKEMGREFWEKYRGRRNPIEGCPCIESVFKELSRQCIYELSKQLLMVLLGFPSTLLSFNLNIYKFDLHHSKGKLKKSHTKQINMIRFV